MSEPTANSTAPAPSPSPPEAPRASVGRSLVDRLAGLSDARLVLFMAAALFALSAWPLLLVDLPPFQDLPNHVATAHIIAHPDLYPEYVLGGFFKSNSAFFLWMALFGKLGLFAAARSFAAVVLAANAIALPMFGLRFAGRQRLPIAMLFGWPLVHGFFVSMGMLNFALSFALSLVLLALLDGQRESPTARRGLAIAALACVLWYAHPFPLAIVIGLLFLHALRKDPRRVATWKSRSAESLALLAPLVPAGLLALGAAFQHLHKAEGAVRAAVSPPTAFSFLSQWEIVGHFWLDASGAFTWWGSATLLPALLLPWFAWKGRAERPPEARSFFSPVAVALIAGLYVALPVMLSNWWHLSCRLIPFLWAALVVWVPSRLPRPVAIGLGVCALAFSAALGVDYVRLDRDRAAFTAGMDRVPKGARLLPLVFKKKRTSDFTASLTHAWGYYTVAKDTSAPLVFAVERSYPITYREFPPPALIPPALDRFAELRGTPAKVCKSLSQPAGDAACTAAWRALWDGFWQQAEPRFDHVLAWAMPPETRAVMPASYRRVFFAGELEIYARESSPVLVPPP